MNDMTTKAPADLLLTNGHIVTMNATSDICEAIAIRGGRIVGVGTQAEVESFAGEVTRIVDLDGRTVIPGLIDSHMHMLWCATSAASPQLLDARSVADIQAVVREAAANLPEGEWIVTGAGWHESLLTEGRMPTRWELDEAVPNHPVFIPRGGHVAACNSRALEMAGIDRNTPDPAGGVVVRRESDGEATGMLLDSASMLVRRVLPPPPPVEEQVELLAKMMRQLNGLGLVAVTEPGVDASRIEVYERMRAAARMTIRTDLLYRVNSIQDMPKLFAHRELLSDDLLRFSGAKFMLDGGIEGGRLKEPYLIVEGEQPDSNYRGLLMVPRGGEDELVECMLQMARAGLQVQCHAVGDEAIDVVVRCFERVNETVPIAGLRWAVMHIHLPTGDALERIRRIGAVVTVQDHSVLLGHNMRRWWGDERAAYAAPLRDILDAGLLAGGGTDAPVVPLDPFLCLWWMVTRRTLNGYVLGPEQAITIEEALRLYTINNARIIGVDQDQGSIEVGKLADVAVLDRDILAVTSDEIKDVKVLLTLLGGRVVHEQFPFASVAT